MMTMNDHERYIIRQVVAFMEPSVSDTWNIEGLIRGIAIKRGELTKLLDKDEANRRAIIEEMVFTQKHS